MYGMNCRCRISTSEALHTHDTAERFDCAGDQTLLTWGLLGRTDVGVPKDPTDGTSEQPDVRAGTDCLFSFDTFSSSHHFVTTTISSVSACPASW